MQNNRFVALAIAVFVTLTVAGCSSQSDDQTPVRTPTTNTVDAQPNPVTPSEPIVDPVVEAGRKASLDYLMSAERAALFDDVVPKSGAVIAQALQDGAFGPVVRTNSVELPLQTGEVGWGGISSEDGLVLAWVYWMADGNVDFSKQIRLVSIGYKDGGERTHVKVVGPSDDSFYWVAEHVRTTATPEPPSRNTPPNAMSNPTPEATIPLMKVQDLRELDVVVLDQLRANMVSWFGSEWAQ